MRSTGGHAGDRLSTVLMNKLVYVATNPVKDRLVDKVHH